MHVPSVFECYPSSRGTPCNYFKGKPLLKPVRGVIVFVRSADSLLHLAVETHAFACRTALGKALGGWSRLGGLRGQDFWKVWKAGRLEGRPNRTVLDLRQVGRFAWAKVFSGIQGPRADPATCRSR